LQFSADQVELCELGLLERHPRLGEEGAAVGHRVVEEELEELVRDVVVVADGLGVVGLAVAGGGRGPAGGGGGAGGGAGRRGGGGGGGGGMAAARTAAAAIRALSAFESFGLQRPSSPTTPSRSSTSSSPVT